MKTVRNILIVLVALSCLSIEGSSVYPEGGKPDKKGPVMKETRLPDDLEDRGWERFLVGGGHSLPGTIGLGSGVI